MILLTQKKTGLPFADGLDAVVDLPHTITAAIAIRAHQDSIAEIPKDKRPPRGIWDKPHRLEKFIDEAYGGKGDGVPDNQKYMEYNPEDVE